jgi:multidrug resistance efflux pump
MSEQQTDPAPAPEGEPRHDHPELEGKLDQIMDKLGRLAPGSRGDAQQREEARLDRPSSIKEQVDAELKRAREEEAARAAAEQREAEHQSLAERVAKLSETPPAAPVRRATRLLGWGDGR